jgi:hypothetical protein
MRRNPVAGIGDVITFSLWPGQAVGAAVTFNLPQWGRKYSANKINVRPAQKNHK